MTVLGVCRNPLVGMRPSDMRVVAVGVRIRDLAPVTDGPLICRLNGEWLLREYWEEITQPNDVIEWYDMPQGREGFRVLLQIALVIAYLYTPFAGAIPYLIGAIAAYNLLVPPRLAQNNQPAPGGVFSTSLAGNAARLDQPIWRNCGRVKITPPFAAQPYTEFLPSDIANPTVDCDQYYYAIFAIGVGDYDIEKALIGKTSIHHFADVTLAQYLAPGIQPTTALANVVTSDEVSSSELEESRYVGGFAACRPGDTVTAIGIDVSAAQGLSVTVEWQVEVREINDWGAPLGDWIIVAAESRTADTNTPQRWSNTYTLSSAIRAEVRIARTNPKDTSATERDGIQWIGLRAFLSRPAPLNADTAHFEVVMRASEQLSGFSQRDFSMIVRGRVRTWTPAAGWGTLSGDTPGVFTRNAAWWLADLWTNPIWGEGLTDDRVDLQGLYDWSLTLDARQDRFDFSFASAMDSWEAAQLIARSGRARVFRRNGVYTLARDELEDLPVTAFTPRNTQPKSMVLHSTLPSREQADGVVVEYQSNVTWDLISIECPCPGFSVSDPTDPRFDPLLPAMDSPIYIPLEGVTGAFHAEREGFYQAANLALRTTTVSAKVEMEGMLVAYMDPVRWQPQIMGYGLSGDVAFWDEPTLVMGLTEQPDFSLGVLYLTLQRDDGSLTDPVAVIAGPTVWDVILPALPDFTIVVTDGTRERPKFLLGTLLDCDEFVKVSSITDGGKTEGGAQLFNIEAVVDDDRVHTADNHLLPGPGDDQDPIDDGLDYSDVGGGTVLLHLTNHTIYAYSSTQFGGGVVTFKLQTNGEAHGIGDNPSPTDTTYAGEWTSTPLDVGDSADYEVFVTNISGGYTVTGDTQDAWISLGTERSWTYTHGGGGLGNTVNVPIRVSLRRAGSTITQTTRTITLQVIDNVIV